MINPELFTIKKHLSLNPHGRDYREYWKEEKMKCIDGTWINGIFVPGTLYFFGNCWHIKRQRISGKGEYLARPDIRDLEWIKHYLYLEARGFSGFELDKEYSCDRRYLVLPEGYNKLSDEEITKFKLSKFDEGIIIGDLDFRKKYIPAREYLTLNRSTSLGKALYNNEAKNIIEIGTRGYGKSYNVAAIIGHNFLFDGATDYEDYISKIKESTPLSSETVVGAIESKFSKDLLDKVILGFNELPGAIDYGSNHFPSPLSKSYKGSLESGKFIQSVREFKSNNSWKTEGSRSKIHHRTFADNPFAANGTRPNLLCLEEIGFFTNLLDAYPNLKDCTTVGGVKFGVIWAFGTSGAMESGATFSAQKMFYNTDKYDCLIFKNEYEPGNKKIGYFVPAHQKIDKFRNESGILNVNAAKAFIAKEAEIYKNKPPKEYGKYLQNNPEKPTDAFMVITGGRFAVVDINSHINDLITDDKAINKIMKVEFKLNKAGNPEPFTSNKVIIQDFPYDVTHGTDTAIMMFEPPKYNTFGKVFSKRYIGGWDPVEDDGKISNNTSLQACYILDLWTDNLVAAYVGRTNMTKDFYEQWRRCLQYYNAECNYEKDKKGPYQYFEQKKSLHLLADTPEMLEEKGLQQIKAIGNETKGTRGTTPVIVWGLDRLQEWLETKMTDGRLRLQNIIDMALLKELVAYDPGLNCDRISSLIMLMILREDRLKYMEYFKEKQDNKEEDYIPKLDFWGKNFYGKPNSFHKSVYK